MKQLTPYLTFNGNAREALNFYKDVFQGEILQQQTYGEADYPTPPGSDHLIMYAEFQKDDLFLMVSDGFPGQQTEFGSALSLALEFDNTEEIQMIYERLNHDGSIIMELQDTFWGAKYAKVRDKFGVVWDLNHQKREEIEAVYPLSSL